MVQAGRIGSTRFRTPGALGRLGPLAAALALVLEALLASPLAAVAATGDVGYEDQSYSGTSDPTGTKRAESILWFNDGSWWASMWHTTSSDFHILRLDLTTQTWVDTGVPLDLRADTHADVLWDGTKLYVASHRFVDDEQNAQSGFPSYLYRFSYVAATKTYSLDAGFPVQINNMKTETLVIDKDSTGKLWATWSQNNTIYMNRTLNGDDRTWGTPFALPIATATNLTIDDNSAVVAFGGNSIGVMWSNQTTANDAMWFAVHLDSDPETTWQAARTAIQGPGSADDHMNLKTLTTDTAGRVYAAVKTSFNNAAQPQIMLLVRDPSSGNWSSYAISRVSNCPNRVIVLVDEENGVLHAFFTAPGPPTYSCNTSGGAIYTKSSPLDAIGFPVGSGTVVIQDADSPVVHNVTSTKQNVSSVTGIAVLARNSSTKRYWHAYLPIAPSTPPPPVASFSGGPTSGMAPLNVAFTDTSTGSPTSWSWDFGDGTTSTTQHPTKTYSAAGTYTVALTVSNAAGSDTRTEVAYVSVTSPPPATISRESVRTTVNATATTTVVIATPAGTAAGDVLVACIVPNATKIASTGVPAGWVEIAAVIQGTSTRAYGYYKVAGSSEPVSYTWTLNASVKNAGGIARYSGVDTATPLDATPRSASGTTATMGTVPAVTTSSANAMLVGCMGIDSSSTGVAITSPTGMTEAWDIGGKRHELADGLQVTPGSSGAKTWTFSSGREWAGWLVALRPR
jgi:PKD repeat protein